MRKFSSGNCCASISEPTSEGFDHLIDPPQWMHLQFGLFSILTSGPQLSYVLYFLWENAYKRSRDGYWKE